jgi:hypothetical protein
MGFQSMNKKQIIFFVVIIFIMFMLIYLQIVNDKSENQVFIDSGINGTIEFICFDRGVAKLRFVNDSHLYTFVTNNPSSDMIFDGFAKKGDLIIKEKGAGSFVLYKGDKKYKFVIKKY